MAAVPYGASMQVSVIGAAPAAGSANPVITAPYNSTSLAASGTQTAPTAGTAIATLAAPAAGTYEIQVWVAVAGTATTAAADSSNMNLKAGATTVAGLLPYNCSTAGSVSAGGPYSFQRIMDGSTNLTVNAIANATAGTLYTALVIATRIA